MQEEKKTFTSITTDNVSFEEAGLSTFCAGDIRAKFDRMKEKNSTVKIIDPSRDVQDLLDDQPKILAEAADYLMLDGFNNGDPTNHPTFMMFDIATKNYKEFGWVKDDPVFGILCTDMMASGAESEFDKHFVPIGKTRTELGLGAFTSIEAATLVAEEYNLGYTAIKAGDSAEVVQRKNLKNKFITGVQTSLSGCMRWSKPFDFILNADNVTNATVSGSLCEIRSTANFEMRFYDQQSPRGHSRTLVGKGSPKFNFVPTHPWGTAYAGNRPFTGNPGEFPQLDPGGPDNPANNVTAELDVYYNPNTGRAEAGTRQVLAKILTPISAVKVNPMPANFDTTGGFPMPEDSNTYMGYFASGYAIPMTVNQGNPYMFGPVFSNKGNGCEDDKKDKLLVVNRSQRSFPVGRVVMLQRIDDEWIPMDFGDDDVPQFGSVGKWNFQYLIADRDSYFKDDRHYFEEQYNAELSTSITPTQYESLFRFSFYDSMVDAIEGVYGADASNNAGLDAANDPRNTNGTVQLPNTTETDPVPTGTANSNCTEQTEGSTNTDSFQPAPRIEANNGVYVKTKVSSVPSPCFTPSDECGDALQDLRDAAEALSNGGSYDDFEAAMKTFAGVLGEDTSTPAGDPSHPSYDGRLKLDAPPAQSNHNINSWPSDGGLYTANLPVLVDCVTRRRTSSSAVTGGPTDYWARLFSGGVAGVDSGEKLAEWQNSKNWFYSVMACQTSQNVMCLKDGNILSNQRRCVEFGPIASYAKSYADALVEKFEGVCGVERDAFPQIKTFKWLKNSVSKKFVGSRRYLNVTSFDMLSHRWNGHNAADWISLNNPSFDESGGKIEDPSDENFDNYHPFWGALFTEGYTDSSVTKLVTKRSNNSTLSQVCSNANTTTVDSSHFGDLYLKPSSRPEGGFTGSDDTAGYSYGIKKNNTVLSLDKIYSNGDINLTHLPADIGTNASPSGKYGSPINDFHRMVNLANIVNPGLYNDPNNPADTEALGTNFSDSDGDDTYIGYDPKRALEDPTAGQASLTVDWGNGKGLKPNKLALNMKKYFARKYYDVNGVKFSIQDRQCWAYELPEDQDAQQDENGNDLGQTRITQYAFDSTYDLEPVSNKLTFMPLTAEWIGAFDSADQVYALQDNHRAFSGVTFFENWWHIAYEKLNTPYSSYSLSVYPHGRDELKGAGWYWFDYNGKGTQLDNVTIKRLSHYPLATEYNMIELNNPSTLLGSAAIPKADPTVYPAGSDYVETYNNFGGRRGDQIFRIGRNHEFVITPGDSTEQAYGDNTGGGTGEPGEEEGAPMGSAPNAAGGTSNFDIEFMEPENEGVAQIDTYAYGAIGTSAQNTPNNPNHGLVGAYSNRNQADTYYTVKLEPGFPFDGYVRHRSNFSDDGIIGPRQCWFDDTADCVGIITSRANLTTASNNLVCTSISSRGLPTYKPNITGDELGSWGAPSNEIQSFGGEHLFARVFESWPDDQTLFDARYFAVMHFNPGELLTAPITEGPTDENPDGGFDWEGVKYTRELISETVDYRVPTLVGEGNDTREWPQLVQGTTLYANNVSTQGLTAPFELWKVSTIRRGMLLPFTYTLPTVGITRADIEVLVSLPTGGNPAVPQTGTGYKVGDTLTFQGGTGSGAQIRVTEIGANGSIQEFKIVSEGKDFVSDDFLPSNWQNDQLSATFESPKVVASPDPGCEGTGAFILAKSGTVIYKDLTDAAPRTGQSTPQRISLPVPSDENEAVGRQEDLSNQVSLPLPGSNGTFKSYDVFFHYHNDITTVLSYNGYDSVNKGLLKDINKVQFMRLELSTL